MIAERSKRQQKIRVVLVDDHPIVRSGIRKELASRRDISIVGEAGTGKEALKSVEEHRPDIILMDVSMPNMNGVELARRLRKQAHEVKILVFTIHNEKEYILEFAKLGVRGYMSKDASKEDLVRAIQTVHAGKYFFSNTASEVLVNQYLAQTHHEVTTGPKDLTQREMEILTLIAEGNKNKAIATQLKVSSRTIETHRERIMKKLDIHTAVGLAQFAIEKGYVKVPVRHKV